MAEIKITKNSKNIGPGCRYSLDIVRGCANQCLGCYARAVYYQGPKTEFDKPKLLELCPQRLAVQLKNFAQQENPILRIGVNSEPCIDTSLLREVLDICSKSGVQVILITKNIVFSDSLLKSLLNNKAILHISLGMITKARLNKDRYETAVKFEDGGVRVIYRIIDDVTNGPNGFFKKVLEERKLILVTPLRARSYDIAKAYKLNLSKYTFHRGYFRPNYIHKNWKKDNVRFCGDIIIGGKTECLCGKCFIE